MSEFEALADQLAKHPGSVDRPFLIAIDGRSGVGKSTLALRLSQQLNARIVNGDDFFAGGTGLRKDPPEALAQVCIDRVRLGVVLKRLKFGQTVKYKPLTIR